MPLIDITGSKFGRLTVLDYAGSLARKPRWHCRCDCGAELAVRGDLLKSGNTKSCGCQKIEAASRHGHSHSRPDKPPSTTYVSWQAMTSRCRSPKVQHYERYGGAGITVCERWSDFTAFLADMGERPAGHTLDRIDNSLGYSPENCRWASPLSQARNRKTNRMLTHAGKSLSVSEWADVVGIPRTVLQDRIRLGWDAQRILTTSYAKRS